MNKDISASIINELKASYEEEIAKLKDKLSKYKEKLVDRKVQEMLDYHFLLYGYERLDISFTDDNEFLHKELCSYLYEMINNKKDKKLILIVLDKMKDYYTNNDNISENDYSYLNTILLYKPHKNNSLCILLYEYLGEDFCIEEELENMR